MPWRAFRNFAARVTTAEQLILVGFLEPASSRGRRSKRWIARTAHWTTVPGGHWITRRGALVHLVDDYQRRRLT